MVRLTPAPLWDPRRRRLRASPRQLGVLARVGRGVVDADDELAARHLRAHGLLDPHGGLAEGLEPVARAVAGASLEVATTRRSGGRQVVVGLAVSQAAVVVMRQSGADDIADVAVQPVWRLARTIWRVLQLGPRPSPADRRRQRVTPDDLLAAVDGPPTPASRRLALGDGDGVALARVDVADAGHPVASLVIVDGGERGLWGAEASDGGLDLFPTTPLAVLASLTTLQPRPHTVEAG